MTTKIKAGVIGDGVVGTTQIADDAISQAKIADDAVGAAQIAANALGINDLSNATINSADPAIDTNPSGGVGTLWVNSTSGEVYVCTSATTDANNWFNVGEGTGNIFAPYQISYLVVAGGGAGAGRYSGTSGGGGAGGMLVGTHTTAAGIQFTATIGAGGTGQFGAASNRLYFFFSRLRLDNSKHNWRWRWRSS